MASSFEKSVKVCHLVSQSHSSHHLSPPSGFRGAFCFSLHSTKFHGLMPASNTTYINSIVILLLHPMSFICWHDSSTNREPPKLRWELPITAHKTWLLENRSVTPGVQRTSNESVLAIKEIRTNRLRLMYLACGTKIQICWTHLNSHSLRRSRNRRSLPSPEQSSYGFHMDSTTPFF